MSKRNPFLTKISVKIANSKRISKSTPEEDATKVKLAEEAISILKKVRAHYQKASSIDAVKQTRKNYHLGNIQKTAHFMNTLATLAPNERKQIKQIVAKGENDDNNNQGQNTPSQPQSKASNNSDNDKAKPVAQPKQSNIPKTTGQFKLSTNTDNKDNDNQQGKIKIDVNKKNQNQDK